MKKINDDKLESLTFDELKNRVSKSKKLRNNIAGFSSLSREELITAIKKVQEGDTYKKRKQSQSYWRDALMEYNRNKDTFSIPKLGTKAHTEIKQLAEKLKKEDNMPVSELKKVLKKENENDKEIVINEESGGMIKPKRGRPKKT